MEKQKKTYFGMQKILFVCIILKQFGTSYAQSNYAFETLPASADVNAVSFITTSLLGGVVFF